MARVKEIIHNVDSKQAVFAMEFGDETRAKIDKEDAIANNIAACDRITTLGMCPSLGKYNSWRSRANALPKTITHKRVRNVLF